MMEALNKKEVELFFIIVNNGLGSKVLRIA